MPILDHAVNGVKGDLVATGSCPVNMAARCPDSAFRAFFVAQIGKPDRNHVAMAENFLGYAFFVDENAIPAAPVYDSGSIIVSGDDCMPATYVAKVELYVVV